MDPIKIPSAQEISKFLEQHDDNPRNYPAHFNTDDLKPGTTILPKFMETQCEEFQEGVWNFAFNKPKEFYFDLASFLYKGKPPIILLHPSTVVNLTTQIHKTKYGKPSILIHGGRGSGKELLARRIHQLGPRNKKLFLPVDCGALSEDLAESELFGHAKGAFTGAFSKKTGILQEAHEGVVFLDEIAKLSPRIQGKLMRALQEKAVRPVGSNKYKNIDVQIYAATNERLEGRSDFLPDLYDRLNGQPVYTPSVFSRENGALVLMNEDLRALATFFILEQLEIVRLQTFDDNGNVPKKLELTLSKEQFFDLWSTPYDGNVRQMETHCRRAVVEAFINQRFKKDSSYFKENFYRQLTPGTIENIKFKAILGKILYPRLKRIQDNPNFSSLMPGISEQAWGEAWGLLNDAPSSPRGARLLDTNAAYLTCMNAQTYIEFKEAKKGLEKNALANWIKTIDRNHQNWLEKAKAEKVGLTKERWSKYKNDAGIGK